MLGPGARGACGSRDTETSAEPALKRRAGKTGRRAGKSRGKDARESHARPKDLGPVMAATGPRQISTACRKQEISKAHCMRGSMGVWSSSWFGGAKAADHGSLQATTALCQTQGSRRALCLECAIDEYA